VPFRFRQSACVAVGTFNIYIVQPKWLADTEIIGREASPLEIDVNRPGFRFYSHNAAIRWHVRPDRLTVESDDYGADCGTPVANVLDTLQWTPLIAVGVNTEFVAEREILGELNQGWRPPDIRDMPGYTIRQTTRHAQAERTPYSFNVQLSVLEANVTVSLNVHLDVSGVEQHQIASQQAQESCRLFFQHRREAVQLAREILGVPFNEHNND
jgi:hypothetical protein